MSLVPVMLRAERVHALVVGGGTVGTRKALALHAAGASVHVVAPVLSTELETAARECGRLQLSERPFAERDVEDATIVVAATSDRAVNAAVARTATRARRLVSVADAPEEGSFTAAAVHRAGELVIGVSAGGVPDAAARIRDALANRFDDRYAQAILALRTLRRSLLGGTDDGTAWRAAARELIDEEFVDSVESGTFAERARQWA